MIGFTENFKIIRKNPEKGIAKGNGILYNSAEYEFGGKINGSDYYDNCHAGGRGRRVLLFYPSSPEEAGEEAGEFHYVAALK